MAQEVEHILGKDEVTSSSLVSSSTKKHTRFGCVFLMCAKFFAHICTISSKLCVEPVVCARCLFLQAIPHLRLPSAALWFILSQEPVVCARRSRILRALIAFSCRQQLIKYRLFTTKTSCFFNAFLTHLRDLFPNRAWSLSSALDAFSCKQSPRLSLSSAAPLKNTPFRVCFFNVCKKLCTHLHNFFEIVRGACRLRSAIANTSCSHRLSLSSAAPLKNTLGYYP